MTSAVQAQATRTWVSGVGDDANPCSRTAPCKTFPGAYSRTAPNGEIDALDPGGFGTITIGKSITIDGGGGIVASILAGSGAPGVTVNAGAADHVTLRNIRITGAGLGSTGINFIAGNLLSVENVTIENFTNVGIDFEPVNRAFLQVTNTTVQNNPNGGIVVSTGAGTGGKNRAAIVGSRIYNNGFGIKSGQHSRVDVYETVVANNQLDAGVVCDGTGAGDAELAIEHSKVTNNQIAGLHAKNNGIIRTTGNEVTYNNGFGFLFDTGGQILTYQNNHVTGNSSGDGTASPGPLTPL